MLDIQDFIIERGGTPDAIRDSQRRRGAPEKAVDDVIALYHDHRTSKPPLVGMLGDMLAYLFLPKPNMLLPRPGLKLMPLKEKLG